MRSEMICFFYLFDVAINNDKYIAIHCFCSRDLPPKPIKVLRHRTLEIILTFSLDESIVILIPTCSIICKI